MSKPTADWERVGDRFYRKIQLYTSVFDQDLELENYVVAGAPLSGAVRSMALLLRHLTLTLLDSDIPRREQIIHLS